MRCWRGTGDGGGGSERGRVPPRCAPGEAPSRDGVASLAPGSPGDPTLRWSSQATTIPGIEHELARFWALPQVHAVAGDPAERTIAARTSVLNLVVVARSPELGERAASTLSMLTGRHPSRTLILVATDPDGPDWLRAQVKAYCMVPRAEAPETCAEQIYATAGGDDRAPPRRDRRAAAGPRPPGHALVARRAAVRHATRPGPDRHGRPARGGRFELGG